ncbi:MAG: hypothetical protein AB1563_08725, partial [Bacillota bacterium]
AETLLVATMRVSIVDAVKHTRGLMRGDCALLSAFYNARALGKPPCTALHILRAPEAKRSLR